VEPERKDFMKTWVSKKTGMRYSDCGWMSWFRTTRRTIRRRPAGTGYAEVERHEHFIRPGAPDCTRGWKKLNLKQWTMEDVPTFQGYCPTLDDPPEKTAPWRAYVDQVGVFVAMDVLPCCDAFKESWARQILRPPTGLPTPEEIIRFRAAFNIDPTWLWEKHSRLLCPDSYVFDLLRFEEHLRTQFCYNPDGTESIRDFIVRRWSVSIANLVEKLIAPTKEDKARALSESVSSRPASSR
jgi:hypothetical protein